MTERQISKALPLVVVVVVVASSVPEVVVCGYDCRFSSVFLQSLSLWLHVLLLFQVKVMCVAVFQVMDVNGDGGGGDFLLIMTPQRE
jgi:hypothetical protein